MAVYDPITWVPYLPWVLVLYILWDAYSPLYSRKEPARNLVSTNLIVVVVYIISRNWSSKVSETVPEPYLDEVFHIPQAQAYCTGDFHIWDPKLTTPPGLYIFTTLFCNLAQIRNCDVDTLRWFNASALAFSMLYAGSCYVSITRLSGLKSSNIIHNMLNLALFPPLFFFSGLFYTDVLSTCVVLRLYRDFLNGRGGVGLYFTGIVALTMRQTNIFWAAVFLGGLEAVRTLKGIQVKPGEKQPSTWKDIVSTAFHRYQNGEIHDVSLRDAEVYDFALCGLSIAIAIVFHPILILKKLWPYISMLLSFAYFVYWNGGVVLGDKQNHVATIHLPQLLYLWPFVAFFSLPLLLPSILVPLSILLSSRRRQSIALKLNSSHLLFTLATLVLALFTILAIIRYNTLIHPFTLADNRHYMFYVFRYTILRHPLIRYFLAPIYILCFHLCYTTLSTSPTATLQRSSPSVDVATTPAAKKTLAQAQQHGELQPQPRRMETGAVSSTSWFLIWFGATALSLLTAPLVEPRYFILPWVVFRLHVPSLTLPPPLPRGRGARAAGPRGLEKRSFRGKLGVPGSWGKTKDWARYWAWEGHDPRLWLETAWFAAINVVTAYVFLYKGFEWKQEPGNVQRFMW